VEPLAGFRLHVTFVDGTAGEVDLSSLLQRPDIESTVFGALRDIHTFDQAEVVLGAVTWPNGVDLAPDAMHEAIRLHGRWALD
jgi:hypothetical protein